MSHLPPTAASVPEWIRNAANVLNPVANGYPFPRLDTAPANVEAGFTYYDTTLNKVRTWDGSTFQNHF